MENGGLERSWSDGGTHSKGRTGEGTGTRISDDPDYSPDGRYIYFNSDRCGSMQIWRMHSNGSSPEQMTNDDWVNWTAHPSPDGKSIVFISYEPGTTGHPANRPIALRVMSLDDRRVHVLFRLTAAGER